MSAIGALIVGLIWTSSTVHGQARTIGHLQAVQGCLNTVVATNRAQHEADQEQISYLGQEVAALSEQVRELGAQPITVPPPAGPSSGSSSSSSTPGSADAAPHPSTTTTTPPASTTTTRPLIPAVTLPTLLVATAPTSSAC